MSTAARILIVPLLWIFAAPVAAHNVGVSYVQIVTADAELAVHIDVSLRDLEFVTGLDRNGDTKITWGEVSANFPSIAEYVVQSLAIARGEQRCSFGKSQLAIDTRAGESYAALILQASCPTNGAVRVKSDLLFGFDDSHRTLLTVRSGQSEKVAVLTNTAREWNESTGASAAFLRFVGQGMWHIWIGFDHLVFLGLLLLPLLQSQQRWTTIAGEVLHIVTAFTLAHSITLLCAALGYVNLPSRWVEASIAASIVIAAFANLLRVPVRFGILMAFGFGLIHGFGFAGALAGILEASTAGAARLVPLLGFNLGVEIGQLAVVAAVFPLLFARRGLLMSQRAIAVGSLAMGACGFHWLLQRTVLS